MTDKILPQGWEWKTLGDLIDFVIGGDWGKDVDDESESDWMIVKCIRGSELKNWNKEKGLTAAFRKIKPTSLATRKLKAGDIILEISGGGPEQPVGRTVLIDNSVLFIDSEYPKVCTNFFRLLRPSNEVNSYFLNYYLTFFYLSGEVIKYQGGSNNLRNLKFKEYEQIPIPIPPLPEQQRIAARLDVLMEQLENAKKALAAFPDMIKSFRQAVLAQAVSGKLTEDWREGVMDWEEETFGEVTINFDGKRKPLSQTERENFKGNFPYYGACEIIDYVKDYIYDGSFMLVGEDGANLLTKSKPLAFIAKGKFWVNNHAHVVKPKENLTIDYLCMYFNSLNIKEFVSGSAQPKLNQKNLNKIPIVIPPLPEQEEIVRRVERLFAYADSLEQQYAALQEKLAILPQAILAKAFRGEM